MSYLKEFPIKKTPQERKEAHKLIVKWYTEGYFVSEIMQVTKYTQPRIYQLLAKAGVPARIARVKTKEIDSLLSLGYARTRKEIALFLSRAKSLERSGKFLVIQDLRDIGISSRKEKAAQQSLQALGLYIAYVPFPHLYHQDTKRYYQLAVKDLMLLYLNPHGFLKDNAELIKNGWQSLKNGYSAKVSLTSTDK